MTAQPIDPDAPLPWAADPVRLWPADHTIEDVLAMPGDAPRVEVRDGVMSVVPSPTTDHRDIGLLICSWLRPVAAVTP